MDQSFLFGVKVTASLKRQLHQEFIINFLNCSNILGSLKDNQLILTILTALQPFDSLSKIGLTLHIINHNVTFHALML